MTRRTAFVPTLFVALACFGVVFEFLAMQLSSGRDPALGTPAASAPAAVKPRRKIVITKVIPAKAPGGALTSSTASSASATPAPVATSSS